MIARENLQIGAYYFGFCRNASIARWNGKQFLYWRYKFGMEFLETISHSEDDNIYDAFIPEKEIEDLNEIKRIPIE